MDLVVAVVRVVLAAVLLVAAVGKALDLPGSRDAVIAFRIPARVAGLVARLLPVAEVAVAVLLLVTSTARVGGAGAVVLFALFLAVVTRAVRAGEAPPCHCFGQVRSEPVGRVTIVRNAALLALAAMVLVGGAGRSIVGGHVPGWAAAALATACFAAVAAAWSLRARVGAAVVGEPGTFVLPHDGEPPVAGPAAPLDLDAVLLRSTDGSARAMATLLDGRRELVVVGTAGGCGPCKALIPRVRAWQRSLAPDLAIVVVQWGRPADLPSDAGTEVFSVDRPAFDALGFSETPSAVVIGVDGTPQHVVAGTEAVEVVVRRALRRTVPA